MTNQNYGSLPGIDTPEENTDQSKFASQDSSVASGLSIEPAANLCELPAPVSMRVDSKVARVDETSGFAIIGKTLLANAYRIIPIKQGEKRPAIANWQNSRLGGADLDAYEGYGIGILCGQGIDPVVGVDIDISHPVIGPAIISWCRDNLGHAPERVGAAPRVMLVYKASSSGWAKGNSVSFYDPADPVKPSGNRNEQQIEILGMGQQFVAYAIHPDTGKPYEWVDVMGGLEYTRAQDLPLLTEEHIEALFV
jgi:putative DNA primase/helicase